jgi:hypothetical protein
MTQRMKNIEEFGSPLTQLSRVLLTVLTQMRLNLSEVDHPIHVIVGKFQEIITKQVELLILKHKQALQQQKLPQGRTFSKPVIQEVDGQ